MDWARLDPPPVGVRVLRPDGEAADNPAYRGISYCDAVRRAGEGEVLRVLPDSIQVCRWTPVVLGLKQPEDSFEQGLAPRLDFPVVGLLLAPLDRFPGEPEVVLVRADMETLQKMIALAGSERLWADHQGRIEWSAVPLLNGEQMAFRHRLVNGVNRGLAILARSGRWRAFTYRLFRSRLATRGYDALISYALADMSMCRNSTVIPRLADRINVSFFCSGGITWGRNRPDHMTSGWPWHDFQQLLQSPGGSHE
jgi:hypothetical protein